MVQCMLRAVIVQVARLDENDVKSEQHVAVLVGRKTLTCLWCEEAFAHGFLVLERAQRVRRKLI